MIGANTHEDKYIAQEIYCEELQRAKRNGAFTDEELLDYLMEQGYWDVEKEKTLAGLPKDIDELKVKLFKAVFASEQRAVIRKMLATAKSKLSELAADRSSHIHLSCSGLADISRTRYLIGSAARLPDGSKLFNNLWMDSSEHLDEVLSAYFSARLPESTIRELARSQPWRSIWDARRCETSLFGIPAADYTDEQRSLVAYSQLYDSAMESPDYPGEEVVKDDDMFDGWLIDQKRQRDAQLKKKGAEQALGNEQIRNSGEVFIVVETEEDRARVEAMNDPAAAAAKRLRMKAIQKYGEVREDEMPDTKQEIRMEYQKMATARMRGK